MGPMLIEQARNPPTESGSLMLKLSPRILTLLAATAAAGASGAAISGAASSGTTGTHSAQRAAGGPGETALTGDTKQKVEDAVSAKLPGARILRTTTDRGGAYESHVLKADGTEVEVKVAKDFTVSSVEERPAGGRGHGGPGGRGGPGGHGGPHADLATVAKALDVNEAALQSALEAARPDRSAGPRDPGAERAAALAKSLGESTADVRAVLDSVHGAGDHGPRGRGPGGHDDTALVAALVKTFSVSQSKAQAAVDAAEKADRAEHTARERAMYAAVAKALGKDTAAVQKAFEAGRPAVPTP